MFIDFRLECSCLRLQDGQRRHQSAGSAPRLPAQKLNLEDGLYQCRKYPSKGNAVYIQCSTMANLKSSPVIRGASPQSEGPGKGGIRFAPDA